MTVTDGLRQLIAGATLPWTNDHPQDHRDGVVGPFFDKVRQEDGMLVAHCWPAGKVLHEGSTAALIVAAVNLLDPACEVIDAAEDLTADPFGSLEQRKFYKLREALAAVRAALLQQEQA